MRPDLRSIDIAFISRDIKGEGVNGMLFRTATRMSHLIKM
jgi:hypothetical protein